MEVSNFSLTTFRTCNKKYWWLYIQGIKSRKKVSALTLGDIIHKSFDKYYKGEGFADIAKWINKSYKDDMSNLPPEEQEQCYLDSKTALGMFLNFPFDSMHFDKIDSEKEFKTPIDKDITYVGRVDGLVEHTTKWFVREVKTTGEARQMFENRANISSQATGYVWGIQQALNIPITGVLYDCIRKPRLYKRESEDMYSFGQRIYLDYCDKGKHKSYFYRYPTYRTQNDIDLWLDDTKRTSIQMKRCIDENDFPRNTQSCWVFNAECPYRRICFEKTPDPMILDLLYERRWENGKDGREENNTNGKVSGGDGIDAALSR